MTDELLLQGAKQIAEECAGKDMLLTSAKIVAYLMDNCDIAVPENSEFFVKVSGRQVTRTLYREQLELQKAEFFDEFRPGQTAEPIPAEVTSVTPPPAGPTSSLWVFPVCAAASKTEKEKPEIRIL